MKPQPTQNNQTRRQVVTSPFKSTGRISAVEGVSAPLAESAKCNAAPAPSVARFEVRGTARTPGIPRESREIRHSPRARGRVRPRSRALSLASLDATREPGARFGSVGDRACAAGSRASCGACAVFPAACAAVVLGFWGVGGGWSDKSEGDDGAMSRAMARAREETPGTRRRRGRGSARRRGCGARAVRETLPPGCRWRRGTPGEGRARGE